MHGQLLRGAEHLLRALLRGDLLAAALDEADHRLGDVRCALPQPPVRLRQACRRQQVGLRGALLDHGEPLLEVGVLLHPGGEPRPLPDQGLVRDLRGVGAAGAEDHEALLGVGEELRDVPVLGEVRAVGGDADGAGGPAAGADHGQQDAADAGLAQLLGEEAVDLLRVLVQGAGDTAEALVAVEAEPPVVLERPQLGQRELQERQAARGPARLGGDGLGEAGREGDARDLGRFDDDADEGRLVQRGHVQLPVLEARSDVGEFEQVGQEVRAQGRDEPDVGVLGDVGRRQQPLEEFQLFGAVGAAAQDLLELVGDQRETAAGEHP